MSKELHLNIPMRKLLLSSLLVVPIALISFSNAQSVPLVEPSLPYSPSLDVSSIDKSVDPCVDFYQYSCGGWQQRNPIPPDQVSWGVSGKLYQDNLNFLRGILEEAAATRGRRDTVTQEIGDFF